jgi:transaldolase
MIDVQAFRQGNVTTVHPVTALLAEGQSVWQDDISRDMLQDGSLRRRIDTTGIRGLTSNPSIFARAIAAGEAYDREVERLLRQGSDAREIFETLAVDDIRAACDLFRSIYEESSGGDGFVSIEVSPDAARDPEATRAEARRLWSAVDRPNLMIKVPGTSQSVAVVEDLLAAGINVNITLLFSIDHYERVARAYIAALERRRASGQPIDRIASVASFFVGRVDALVDRSLDAKIAETRDPAVQQRLRALQGTAAVANAKLAYARFRQIFAGPRWETLQAAGARVQRPLWASTSTKAPTYRDVIYVEELIGPDTVTTVPRATLDAFLDHGVVYRTVDWNLGGARRVVRELAAVGIELDAVTDRLEGEGIAAFAQSFDTLLAGVEAKRARLSGRNARRSDLRRWEVAP